MRGPKGDLRGSGLDHFERRSRADAAETRLAALIREREANSDDLQRLQSKDLLVASMADAQKFAVVAHAAEACKPYLTKVVQAEKRNAFGGKVILYLDNIFEVKAPLSKPALINFRVHPADGFSEIANPILAGPAQ